MNASTQRFAITILRVGLGIVMLAHGLCKIFIYTMPGTVAYFEHAGFAGWMAYPVMAGEIAGGLLLIVGLLTRAASLAVVPILAGALVTLWPNGWLFNAANGGGWEFVAFLIVAAIVQSLLGPGPLAVDNVRHRTA